MTTGKIESIVDEAEKQKLTEIIFEQIQDGIVMLDRGYRIVTANRSVEKWIDKSTAEIAGKDSREIFHERGCFCPHCAAEATFSTGKVNIITQKIFCDQKMFFAELSSYPVHGSDDEVVGCVVFIQDITERMKCHSEITQTKEYLEGIIENSADAIVTTDLNGIITSWNEGAKRIYGFTKEEAIGKFLPFVPEFLLDPEWENNRRVRNGEVLKRIETLRRRKDGAMITVSLTLSPIKSTAGEVIGISGISRDISEVKGVEKELVRRNQELSRLFFISSAMRGTLELNRLLRMVLTAVTMGDGLGFNRSILFLVDEKNQVLKGAMGVGPASHEEAYHIWDRLSIERKTLHDIMQEIEVGPSTKDSYFDRIAIEMEIPLEGETVLTRTVKEMKQFNVQDVRTESLSDPILIQLLGTQAFAVVPLISRHKVIGVLWVDNYFNRKPITDEDMRFLTAFSNHVASAIENARLFEQVILTEQELENIFESISDMVIFVSEDYVVRNINKAVSKRLGKAPEEIVGRKCYEVFHGTRGPWEECPHRKTTERRAAYVEEVEDPYLGGTFITSSSPIFDINGAFIGTVNVMSDITELKTLRERVIRTERMAALGEVAARVAHEIRNPLVSLGGFARRLERRLDGNLKEYADIIAKEVGRLEGILSEILSFVKETRVVKEVVNPDKIIDDVIVLVKPDLDEKSVRLVRESGHSEDIYVDPNRMREALLNIVRNAIQAVDNNGTISVKTYAKDDGCVFEISDNGGGISEADIPFIFDPFFTTKKSGTGLGLTITHRIAEEHRGSIQVESRPGAGTTFRVFIPYADRNKPAGKEGRVV
ncbi:MAG: PAS domain S-box protein [Nitrospirota bacterium]